MTDTAVVFEKGGMHAQMLARMKQDASVPSQRGDSPFEAVPPLGGPTAARRSDSAADDATPRTGGLHARKPSQLVRLRLRPWAVRNRLCVVSIIKLHQLLDTECMRERVPLRCPSVPRHHPKLPSLHSMCVWLKLGLLSSGLSCSLICRALEKCLIQCRRMRRRTMWRWRGSCVRVRDCPKPSSAICSVKTTTAACASSTHSPTCSISLVRRTSNCTLLYFLIDFCRFAFTGSL